MLLLRLENHFCTDLSCFDRLQNSVFYDDWEWITGVSWAVRDILLLVLVQSEWMTGVWNIRRELHHRTKDNSSSSTSMSVFGYAAFYVNCYSPLYSRSYTDLLWQYYVLGNILMGFLGPVVVEQTMSSTDYLNIVDCLHHYMLPDFWYGNGAFMQDNTPCHMSRIVLNCFQEHNTKFQLMGCPTCQILNW